MSRGNLCLFESRRFLVAVVVTLAFLGLVFSPTGWAALIYVDAANHSGNEDGSWASPYNTIQEAVNAAASGDTVVVAEGEYAGGVDIAGKNVTLTTLDVIDPSLSVIDGDLDGDGNGDVPVITFEDGTGGPITSGGVVGFTIQNGANATGSGGGISCEDATRDGTGSPGAIIDVKHNIIQNNDAAGGGGGLAFVAGNIVFNTFTGNTAGLAAGAASNDDELVGVFADNVVYGNIGGDGETIGAGGVQGFEYVYRNDFLNNEGALGGAIDLCEVVRNNLVYGNRSVQGAVTNVFTVDGNTIYANSLISGQTGFAGLYLTNLYFGGASPVVRNNIIYANTDGLTTVGQQLSVADAQYAIELRNSCIQHGWSARSGKNDSVVDVTSLDPYLADPTSPPWDLHLTGDSTSCIDTGYDLDLDPDPIGLSPDIDLHERPFGLGYDMGADETSTVHLSWESDYTGWIQDCASASEPIYEMVDDGNGGYYMHLLHSGGTTGSAQLVYPLNLPNATTKFSYCIDDFPASNSTAYVQLRRVDPANAVTLTIRENYLQVLRRVGGTTTYATNIAPTVEDTWYEMQAECYGQNLVIQRRERGGSWTTVFNLTGGLPEGSEEIRLTVVNGVQVFFDDMEVEGTRMPEQGGSAGGPPGACDFETGTPGWKMSGAWTRTNAGEDDYYLACSRHGCALERTTTTFGEPLGSDTTTYFSYQIANANIVGDGLCVEFRCSPVPTTDGPPELLLRPFSPLITQRVGGRYYRLAENEAFPSLPNTWYDVKIVADGGNVKVWRREQGKAWESMFDISVTTTVGDTLWFIPLNDTQVKVDDVLVFNKRSFAEQYTLTTSVQGSGSISPSSGTYAEGTSVELTATPATGWRFDHWEGGLTGSTNPASLTMDADKSVTAVFIQTYALSTSVQGSGSVSPSGGTYDAGTTVNLAATAASGWVFDHWEGSLTGNTNPASITMNADASVTAVFMQLPTADFSATPTFGAAPLTVQFTDASTAGSGTITAWAWDFNNDGTPDSSGQSPLHQYAAGVYTVSLTVTTAIGSDTEVKTDCLVVEDAPTANFTAEPNPAEVNETVTFTDASTEGVQGDITSWAWTFGDGGTSTDQNPTHAYTAAGLYTVTLTVTKASGATDTETKTDYVVVADGLVADWAFDETSGLTVADLSPFGQELTVSSAQASLGASGIDDFAISVTPNTPPAPAAYRDEAGTTALDLDSQATMMVWFNLAAATADQTVLSKGDPQTSNTGYRVVLNPSGNDGKGVMLQYGDGTSAVSVYSNQTEFATEEWYHLGVVFDAGAVAFYVNGVAVGSSTGNSASFARNDASFRVAADGTDSTPLNGLLDELILYRAALTPAEVFDEYDNVTYTFTDATDVNQGSITLDPAGGVYTHGVIVQLHAVPLTGWTFSAWGGADGAGLDNSQNPVPITMNGDKTIAAVFEANPTAAFTYSVAGLVVTFTDQSTAPTGHTIEWLWDFGDGATSTDQNPVHTYAAGGTYSVTLTVTNVGGVGTDSDTQSISLGAWPKAAIQVDFLDTTPSQVVLTDASIPEAGQDITAWAWTFEDATAASTEGPHTRTLASGTHTMTLVVTQTDGHTNSVTVPVHIASGPVAGFTVAPTLKYTDHDIAFTDTSTPGDAAITQWIWDFGDGATATGPGPHVHRYDTDDDYTVTLTVRNEYGSDTESTTVTVDPPPLSTLCPDVTITSTSGVDAGAQFQTDDSISVTSTVLNQSETIECPVGRTDVLYLSLDDMPDENDTILESKTTTAALPGSNSETITLGTAGLIDVAPGEYFLIVSLDDTNVVSEALENNNITTVAITVVDSEMNHE